MKKVGVVLSGCGVYDGAKVNEAVLTQLVLDRAGAQAVCFAAVLLPKLLDHGAADHW